MHNVLTFGDDSHENLSIMDMEVNTSTVGTGLAGLLGIGAIARYAVISWIKDRKEINATEATTQIIATLRDELTRLATAVSETSQLNQQLREERDGLRTEVAHLTYAVNAVKDILVEVLGKEEARTKFMERGIHKRFGSESDDAYVVKNNSSSNKDDSNG